MIGKQKAAIKAALAARKAAKPGAVTPPEFGEMLVETLPGPFPGWHGETPTMPKNKAAITAAAAKAQPRPHASKLGKAQKSL